MSRVVLLDSGPIGLLTTPNENNAEAIRCQAWARELKRKGTLIRVPEIIDYEERREMIRCNSGAAIAALDQLSEVYGYLPLCTETMRRASQIWADVRILGVRSDVNERLDVDMILAAQAFIAARNGDDVWIATGNVRHLSMGWKQSCLWEEIKP
jgi:hypothetical protein